MFLMSVPCISSKCIRLHVYVHSCLPHNVLHMSFNDSVHIDQANVFYTIFFKQIISIAIISKTYIVTYHVVSNVCVYVNLSVSYICLYLSCLSLYVCICVNECFFFLCTGQQGRRIRISMTLGRCLFVFRL